MIVHSRAYYILVGLIVIFNGRALSASIVGQLATAIDTSKNTLPNQQKCVCTPYYACKTYTAESDVIDVPSLNAGGAPCLNSYYVCCDDSIKTSLNQGITNISDSTVNEHDTDSSSKKKRQTNIDSNTNNTNNDDGGGGVDSSTDKDCDCVSLESVENDESSATIPPTEMKFDVNENKEMDTDVNKCGIWNKNGVGSIVEKEGYSQLGEYPSMVALFTERLAKDDEKELMYHCGGSLIGKNVVLTAAHCVNKKASSTFVVRAGEWDLSTEQELFPHQDRSVSKIIVHPEYYAGALHNDIAIIFLEDPFKLQENIQIMCLPEENDIFTNTLCHASGWGKIVSFNNYTIPKKTIIENTNKTGKYEAAILKKVDLPIISREKCLDALRATRLGPKFTLHNSFICAGGEKGKDTCKGDGGGPLMCPSKDDPNHLVQAGIVAWGIDCGLNGIPGTYVNVAGFRIWIDREIEKYHK